jgi:hypothetical protein
VRENAWHVLETDARASEEAVAAADGVWNFGNVAGSTATIGQPAATYDMMRIDTMIVSADTSLRCMYRPQLLSISTAPASG